jgi:hypothetical protein
VDREGGGVNRYNVMDLASLPPDSTAIAYGLWQDLASAPNGTSPLMGEAGRGCESPVIGAKPPPPLIPPRKGEGVDWTIADD